MILVMYFEIYTIDIRNYCNYQCSFDVLSSSTKYLYIDKLETSILFNGSCRTPKKYGLFVHYRSKCVD